MLRHIILRMHQPQGFVQYGMKMKLKEAIRLYGDTKMLDSVNIDDEMVKSTKVLKAEVKVFDC